MRSRKSDSARVTKRVPRPPRSDLMGDEVVRRTSFRSAQPGGSSYDASVLVIADVVAITMDPDRRVVGGAAIAVDGGRIVWVGKAEEVEARFPDAERLVGRGMVALPGLIDAHCHADQSLLRGRTDDLGWVPFLRDWIDPYLALRQPATTIAAYQLSMLEMIRSGTTCFVSPNVDPSDDWDALIASIELFGLRAVLAHWADSPAGVERAADAIGRWDGAGGGRIRVRIGLDIPRLPGDRERPDLYRAAVAAAESLRSGFVYHFCSEVEDVAWSVDNWAMRPAEWARDRGLLGAHALLINACQVSPIEVSILAETATPVVHSPTANMKMASGVAPVGDLREAGVVVALGSDGPANNNSFDLFGEMKTACLLQNLSRRGPGSMHAEDALEMATIGGAVAIGQADDIGSLEEGKRADIVLVDLAQPHTSPVRDPVSNLVYAARGANVATVIVNGEVLMRDGVITVCDERAVMTAAARAASDVDRILPSSVPRWPYV